MKGPSMETSTIDLHHVNFRAHDQGSEYSKDELSRLLESGNVSWTRWKNEGFRTLDDLLDLINDYQVELIIEDKKLLLIKVHVAIVRVTFHTVSKVLELTEEKQVNILNGKILSRNYEGIGETVRKNELAHEAAHRGLREELGFTDPTKYRLSQFPKSDWTDPRESKKWPGITMLYYRRIFTCIIDEEIYSPTGYKENKDGCEINFVWKEA